MWNYTDRHRASLPFDRWPCSLICFYFIRDFLFVVVFVYLELFSEYWRTFSVGQGFNSDREKKEGGTYQSLVKYSQFVVASRTIPNWFCKVNDGGGSVQKGLALESAQMPRDSDVTGFSITSVTDFSQSKYQQAQNGFNFPSPKK